MRAVAASSFRFWTVRDCRCSLLPGAAMYWRSSRTVMAHFHHRNQPSCFVPDFDGALLSHDSKEALWNKFCMAVTTTEAVRRAIQNNQESLRALAKRYGINQKTVANWRQRGTVIDLPTGPKEAKWTVLSH